MTEERLSALLDGECTPAELDQLLDSIERDPALKTRFSRLVLMRDSLQGLHLRRRHLDLADRVEAALAKEAAPAMAAPAANDARAVPWPAMAGLALAAGLAAAVVLVVRPDRAPQPDTVAQTQTPAQTQVVAAAPAATQGADSTWGQLEAQDVRELNDYMVAHSRSRARFGQGMGGTLGYARYTAYSAEYQSTDDRH